MPGEGTGLGEGAGLGREQAWRGVGTALGRSRPGGGAGYCCGRQPRQGPQGADCSRRPCFCPPFFLSLPLRLEGRRAPRSSALGSFVFQGRKQKYKETISPSIFRERPMIFVKIWASGKERQRKRIICEGQERAGISPHGKGIDLSWTHGWQEAVREQDRALRGTERMTQPAGFLQGPGRVQVVGLRPGGELRLRTSLPGLRDAPAS